MQNAKRVRQGLHQQARTTCVIEMNMRQEHVVNIGDVEIPLVQRVDQQWHAVIGASINKGGPTTRNNQVAGILDWAQILRIDGDDTVVKFRYLCAMTRQRLLGPGRFETFEAREVTRKYGDVFRCN